MTGKNYITNSQELDTKELTKEEQETTRKELKSFGLLLSSITSATTIALTTGTIILAKGDYVIPAIALGILIPGEALVTSYLAKVTYKETKKPKVKSIKKRNRK